MQLLLKAFYISNFLIFSILFSKAARIYVPCSILVIGHLVFVVIANHHQISTGRQSNMTNTPKCIQVAIIHKYSDINDVHSTSIYNNRRTCFISYK